MNQLTSARLKNQKSVEKPLLAFFGHHKAASSSIVSILSTICAEMGLKPGCYSNSEMFNGDLKQTLFKDKIDFLLYRSVDYNYVENLNNFRGFHVVRDPRDIVVSAYFSHLHSHPVTKNWPQLVPHRQELKKVSKEAGLFLEMEFRRLPFEKMYAWDYDLPNVLELKMEHLFKDSHLHFYEIFDFLGILDSSERARSSAIDPRLIRAINKVNKKSKGVFPLKLKKNKLSSERLLEIIDENSFAKKTAGRSKGQENVKSHYRKGVPGDWKNHFNSEHIIFFKNNYNDLILKLGYESNPDWWKAYI